MQEIQGCLQQGEGKMIMRITTTLVLALAIGCGVTGSSGPPGPGRESPDEEELSLVRILDPRIHEITPDEHVFKLRTPGKDLALITLDRGEIVQMVIFRPDMTRQVVLSAASGTFPDHLSISTHSPSDPYLPTTVVVDDDMDGIPDRRVEWDEKRVYRRESIRWKLVREGVSRTTTTRPE